MTNRPDETWHRLQQWTSGSAPSERLAAQILLSENYQNIDPSHPLGGPDGGMDALCRKDGVRWIMAAYFPRGQKSFQKIKDKFMGDLAGVAKNHATGIAFVTNQELSLAERTKLEKCCAASVHCELYHVERITAILDQPHMATVRGQFLYIDPADASMPAALIDRQWSALSIGYAKHGEIHAQDKTILPSLNCPPFVPPQPNVNIGALLKWNARIPATLYGRERELVILTNWVARRNPGRDISVMVMHGVGGAGKTRLAFEFAASLANQGWQTGQLSDPANPVAFVLPAQDAGTLLIIDYPEQHHQALQALLKALAGCDYPGCLRVLLLCRKHELTRLIEDIAPELPCTPLALPALEDEAIAWQVFCHGFQAMAQALAGVAAPAAVGAAQTQAQPPLDRVAFAAWLLRDPRHAEPLIVLAFALNLAYDPEARAGPGRNHPGAGAPRTGADQSRGGKASGDAG